MKWTEEVGLALVKRDLVSMTLRTPDGDLLEYTILQVFPFTSESKRMGIIVRVRFSCGFVINAYTLIILCSTNVFSEFSGGANWPTCVLFERC